MSPETRSRPCIECADVADLALTAHRNSTLSETVAFAVEAFEETPTAL